MILTDVNMLIHAFRTDTAQHAICKPWLNSLILGDTQFGVLPLVRSPGARHDQSSVCSNFPVRSAKPCPIATTFCARRTAKSCSLASGIGQFSRLCIATGTRRPRIADAWFAALAIEHGCTWITLDRDYARFADLDGGNRSLEPGPRVVARGDSSGGALADIPAGGPVHATVGCRKARHSQHYTERTSTPDRRYREAALVVGRRGWQADPHLFAISWAGTTSKRPRIDRPPPSAFFRC